MQTLERSQVVTCMSRSNPPAARAGQGEKVLFLTEDAYGGRLRRPSDRPPVSKTNIFNPATGPLYIDGARPGDVLAVEILSIKPLSPATMFTGRGKGPLGCRFADESVGKLPLRAGHVRIGRYTVPLKPMVGVIGVAPRGKPVDTTWPGEHGGNLDCKVISAGATVYLPVYVDGALLALGDVHAVQADGEVAICAPEVKAEVVARARVFAGRIPTPAVETRDALYILASAKTLDKAERLVLDKAFDYLAAALGMNPHDAVRLLSAACDLQICQVVDPLKTLRVRIPKRYL